MRLCEKIEKPFVLMIMAPFVDGILCFQGLSVYSDVVCRVLPRHLRGDRPPAQEVR